MTSVLDGAKLYLSAFTPELAAILGDKRTEPGCQVVSEALMQSRSRIRIRDWLYLLIRHPDTLVRRRLADRHKKTPETFITTFESACGPDDAAVGLPPDRLSLATVADEVVTMLDEAERLAAEHGATRVDETLLTLAILNSLRTPDRAVLESWATLDGIEELLEELRGLIAAPSVELTLFTEDGVLNDAAFMTSGRQLCRRIAEDAASLGAGRIATRHVLYSLLGDAAGLIVTALQQQGLQVSRDFHSVLVRELRRSKTRSPKRASLSRDTVFGPVRDWLNEALRLASARRSQGIAAFDLEVAFARTQLSEITRLVPPESHWSPESFQEFLRQAEPSEDDDPITPANVCPPELLESELRQSLFGQNEAIRRVLPWVKRLQFGLPRDDRPAGVFLFLGPTGTGKTQLAKELARCVYGNSEAVLFVEMGQFKTKESVTGLIGASPGYVGYGEGKLTNGLRDCPECIVLFDEIEKAHTSVFDVVLRFADEGLISDPAGPVRDGRKCIVIMTTNAGQSWLYDSLSSGQLSPDADLGQLLPQIQDAAERELRAAGFRVEFLGRVDETVVFLPLDAEACRSIVDLVIEKEVSRLREHKAIDLVVAEDVRQILAAAVHQRSRREGARCAPRVVNDSVVTPVIDLLLGQAAARRPRRIHVRLLDQQFIRVEVIE